MNYLGDFSVGATVYVPFNTYSSDDPSVSMTITGLAVTDIEIYKDGNMTQRASDAGYTLLDTDGIDLDGTTGIHGFSIDLADNTTADFFTAGSDYMVVVASITLDGGTVNFVVSFSIENRHSAGKLVSTTIATLSSQTSFTLTAGSADDDAYNNCTIVVSDIASGIQKAVGVISDYTGATKTVTLLADPGIFTMAAGDNVSITAAVSAGALASASDIVDEWETQSQADPSGFQVNTMEIEGSAALAAILGITVEGAYDLGDMLRLVAAAVLGDTEDSGLSFRDLADSKDRFTVSIDSSNRTITIADAT